MLDLKRIRDNPEETKKALAAKNARVDIDAILELDARRRELLARVEALKAERNKGSKEVGRMRKAGEDSSALETRMREIGEETKGLDAEVGEVTSKRDALLAAVPNLPAADVPVGADAEGNVQVKIWGEKRDHGFEPKAHWDIGSALGIIDLERASKLSGAGFTLFRGLGARLERALISFMLDIHSGEHGYEEVWPPYLVNRDCMFGTGQLPKLEDDMYRIPEDDLFLIPTAEVPITNLHRDETIPGDRLPVCYAGYTACFRREAGAYGRDTRGMIRVHQFDKVELVRFVRPEDSYAELERLLGHAETILQRLGLHYRVLKLCTGDLSFAAAKCYDIEVWAPGVGRYLEVSSCSNFEDFQARRANIRYRDPETKASAHPHTLNGSGVALPRAVIALVETWQEADGSVTIPEALRPYMGGLERIAVPGA